MAKLSLEYIAGLIDADGSLSITIKDRGYKTNAFVWRPTVNFRQLVRGESVLKDIQDTLGGKIYKHSCKDMMTWQVQAYDDVVRVCEKLLPYLRIKKEACRKMLSLMKRWNGPEFNKHSARCKRQLTRPIELMYEVLDVSLSLNKCRQTETAWRNKAERVKMLKERIKKFYESKS